MLDQESFLEGLKVGLQTGIVIIERGGPALSMIKTMQKYIDRANGKSEPLDGDAEYASWFPTAADREIAS